MNNSPCSTRTMRQRDRRLERALSHPRDQYAASFRERERERFCNNKQLGSCTNVCINAASATWEFLGWLTSLRCIKSKGSSSDQIIRLEQTEPCFLLLLFRSRDAVHHNLFFIISFLLYTFLFSFSDYFRCFVMTSFVKR